MNMRARKRLCESERNKTVAETGEKKSTQAKGASIQVGKKANIDIQYLVRPGGVLLQQGPDSAARVVREDSTW